MCYAESSFPQTGAIAIVSLWSGSQPVEKILRDGDTVLPWGQAERSIVIEMSSPDDRAKRLYRVSAGITRRSTAAVWIKSSSTSETSLSSERITGDSSKSV